MLRWERAHLGGKCSIEVLNNLGMEDGKGEIEALREALEEERENVRQLLAELESHRAQVLQGGAPVIARGLKNKSEADTEGNPTWRQEQPPPTSSPTLGLRMWLTFSSSRSPAS